MKTPSLKVRYYAHVGLQTGYGRAAAELAMALRQHPDVELEIVRIQTSGQHGPDLRYPELDEHVRHTTMAGAAAGARAPASIDPDVVIVHTLPGRCAPLARDEELGNLCCPTVAYTTWEGATASAAVKDALRPFTQIWVPSMASQDPLTTGEVALPFLKTRRLPHAFDNTPVALPRRPDLADRYRFYYVGAWTPRKNPEGLLRAYLHAFAGRDDVELILRTNVSTQDYMTALASSGLDQGALPPISVINYDLSEDALRQLHAEADCYVTASRGEAWDLGAFEAMLARRHIITPRLGSAEFLDRTSADILGPIGQALVPAHGATVRADPIHNAAGGIAGYRMVVTGPTDMTCRDLWAEPDLKLLADLMYDACAEKIRTLAVRYDPAAIYSREAVAETAFTYLQQLVAKEPPRADGPPP